jgi:MFS family permease
MDPRSAWKIYICLLGGTFVTIEAAAFQAPVIPSITRHFNIPVSLAALVMLLYFIALTVFAPIMGRWADQIGRKRMILGGLAVFAVAEFLAAAAPNFVTLLVARFLQGLGVASILPVVYSYVNYLFPEERRGAALGVLIFTMSLGAATGGLLGGLLIDYLGWRSVYWISGALAAIGLLPVALFVPEVRLDMPRPRFDYTGAFALFIAIAAVLSTPIWVDNFGLAAPVTLAAIVAGLLGLGVLWHTGQRAEAPVVDVDILRRRGFALPSIIYWMHILTFSGLIYALAFFISGRPGGSATEVGFVLLAMYGSSMLAAPLSGRAIDSVEPRSVMIAALSLTVFAMLLLTRIDIDTPLWLIVLTVSLLGLTMGTNTPAAMKLTMGAIPKHKMGTGAGMLSMLRDLGPPTGSACSLAVFGSILAAKSEAAVSVRAQALGLADETRNAVLAMLRDPGAPVASGLDAALQARGTDAETLLRMAGADALSPALTGVGYVLAGVAFAALVLCFLLPRASRRDPVIGR